MHEIIYFLPFLLQVADKISEALNNALYYKIKTKSELQQKINRGLTVTCLIVLIKHYNLLYYVMLGYCTGSYYVAQVL